MPEKHKKMWSGEEIEEWGKRGKMCNLTVFRENCGYAGANQPKLNIASQASQHAWATSESKLEVPCLKASCLSKSLHT